MERKNIGAVGLVIGALLLSSCSEVGRYQMVVTPSHTTHVLDTKTGVVFYKDATTRGMFKWDPLNRTLQVDSLTVTDNR